MDIDGLPPDGGDGDSPDRDHPDEEERIFAVAGRDIRVSLTPYYWSCLEDIAAREGVSLDVLMVEIINMTTEARTVNTEARMFLLRYYRNLEARNSRKTT